MHGSEGGKARKGLPIPIFTAATLIIAVPTGIKVWATVRVYEEVFLSFCMKMLENSGVESAESHNAYSDSVKIGGQKPALKRVMRGLTDTLEGLVSFGYPKIYLKAIG